MKTFAILFMLALVVIPTIFVGKTKKSANFQDEVNKTAFELKNFKYSEMNASGLSLIVLGATGYYFENKDAKIAPFTLYRLESNVTEKLFAKTAARTLKKFEFNGDVTYERSNGISVKAQNAIYYEDTKIMRAKPVYAAIETKE